MLEWLKRHAWKACIPLKGIGGSNPPLSAKQRNLMLRCFFVVYDALCHSHKYKKDEFLKFPIRISLG